MPTTERAYRLTGLFGTVLSIVGVVLAASHIRGFAMAYWIWLPAELLLAAHCRLARAWLNFGLRMAFMAINAMGVYRYFGSDAVLVYVTVLGGSVPLIARISAAVKAGGYAGLTPPQRLYARQMEALSVLGGIVAAIMLATHTDCSRWAFLVWIAAVPPAIVFAHLMRSTWLAVLASAYLVSDLVGLWAWFPETLRAPLMIAVLITLAVLTALALHGEQRSMGRPDPSAARRYE